jgi:hypothetical protein
MKDTSPKGEQVMDKDTMETVLDVLTLPLDLYDKAILDVEDGIIKVDSAQTLERLKRIAQDYNHDLHRLRTQFLEAILVEGNPHDEAMVNFYFEILKLMAKQFKLLKPLELKVDQAVMERQIQHLRESFLEMPEPYAFSPEMVNAVLDLIVISDDLK